MIGCASPKPVIKMVDVRVVEAEKAKQEVYWQQYKEEYLLFQLDPGDMVKDGKLFYDKDKQTWVYTRPNQRPLIFNNGRWMLEE